MKRTLLLLLLCCLGWTLAKAQLPNGSVAPNFTGTDLDGNSHTLYDLLDAGKTVFIEVSATWCGPCWNYHNSHAMKNMWNTYGPPGTDEAFVMFIEGDASTNTACLYGPSGCVGGTQGDWVDGTPFPIIDDASIASQLAITFFPTIYCVCPANKKIYLAGQLPMAGLWNFANNICPPPAVEMAVNSVTNVRCINTNTGKIDISVVSGGTPPYSYVWSNGATTQDLNNIPAGTYSCTVTAANGWTGSLTGIDVDAPPSALTVAVTGSTLVGCNGVPGSLTVEGAGGWGGYSYLWNNSQAGETASGLSPGNYTVTVTDDNNCTKTLTANVAPPVYPTALVAPPGTVTCTQSSIQLDGSASSTGSNFTYQWFASNGGNIVNGGNTLTPTVNAGGNYILQVSNTENGCLKTTTTNVQANIVPPSANAGPAGTVTCAVPSTALQGSGSSGSNISYLWTASNGGNIASGNTTLTPTVDAAGTYQLQVTNSSNGCTATSTTAVSGNNVPPTLSTTNGTLTCASSAATLTTTTNATSPTFIWTGPNGYTSTEQSPTVSISGSYAVVVSNPATGCTNTAVASVTSNTAPPGASATGGAITCTTLQVTLTGSSPASQVTYIWTGPNSYTSNLQNPTVNIEGTYNLLVTDTGNGCSSTAVAAVNLNTAPPTAAASTPGNLNCSTAQLQLSGSGSSQGANFTYQWTTANGNIVEGASTLTPLINQVGTYNLVVTNAENGCTSAASTSVAQSQPVTSSISAQNNVLCNGAANGSATVTAGGGNSTYTYAWSNGTTAASANNLAAGTYLVTVSDGENCTSSSSVVISQPEVLVAHATATAQTANGVNDGTATAVPTGGTSTYTYAWSNGGTTATITGLAPGIYTVAVTDANACSAVETVTVNSFNCALSANMASTNVTCFGANNGTATVSLNGAANPVTFLWNNGATTPSVSSLAAGNYSVEVMDANNCPATLNVSISEPTQLAANTTSTNETAAGANDGTATASPTGGISGYTYAWSTGATTASINGLAPGTYTVVVTDANACTASQSVVVNAFNCAIATQTAVSNVSCAGAANGSIALSQTGGTAPFTYLWSNGATTSTISNLAPGTYTASLTDVNGCQAVASSNVTEPAAYSNFAVQTTHPVCPNEATGSASASISGGTMPYNYLWSNGATSSSINNLTVGTYTLVLTDANGCATNTSVAIAATDNVPPTVSAQNASVSLNATGVANIALATVNAQFADNCSVASATIFPTAFDCSQKGPQTVTVKVTDQAGLVTTATATVTVVDDIAPSLTCPASISACSYNNTVNYNPPVASDNCPLTNGKLEQTSGLPSGAAFPVGVTVQTYTFRDESSNVGTCSFEVSIMAPVNFDNVKVSNATNNQNNGAIDITISGGTAPHAFVWTDASGQKIGFDEDLSDLAVGTYSVKVTDANGCEYSLSDIEVKSSSHTTEPSWLTGVRMFPNPTEGLTRIVFAEIPAALLEVSVIDATGRVVLSQISEGQTNISLDCTGLPSGLYSVRFRTNTEVGVRKLTVSR